MAKKLTWSMLTLPPINLWSLPKQDVDMLKSREEVMLDIRELKHWRADMQCKLRADERRMMVDVVCVEQTYKLEEQAKARLKQMDFLYFCRNGRYPDEG